MSSGSPSPHHRTATGSRPNSMVRKSGEMMIMEEDEDEEEATDQDMDVEEVDHFASASELTLTLPGDLESAIQGHGGGGSFTGDVSPMTPLTPLPREVVDEPKRSVSSGGTLPLTAQALAKMQEQQEGKDTLDPL